MTTDTDETLTAELTEAFRRLGMTGRHAEVAARGRDYQPLTQPREIPRRPDTARLTQLTEASPDAATDSADGVDEELAAAFRLMGLSESGAKEAARGR